MKISKILGAVLVLGMAVGLGACSTTGGGSVAQLAGGGVTTNAAGMKAYTNGVQIDNLKVASFCLQTVPKSKTCEGGIVMSEGHLIGPPSFSGIIPVNCVVEPHCKAGPLAAGFSESTINSFLNGGGIPGIAGLFNHGDTFNVAGGTAYGGQATSASYSTSDSTSNGPITTIKNGPFNIVPGQGDNSGGGSGGGCKDKKKCGGGSGGGNQGW